MIPIIRMYNNKIIGTPEKKYSGLVVAAEKNNPAFLSSEKNILAFTVSEKNILAFILSEKNNLARGKSPGPPPEDQMVRP